MSSNHILPKKLQFRILASVGLGIAIYFFLAVYAGFADVRRSMGSLRDAPWLIPAVCGLAFLNYAIRFIKYEYYRKLLGIKMPVATSFLIYLSGFVLSITPGKVGEVFKAYLIKKVDGTRFSRGAPIVIAERFTDLTGYLILMIIGGLSTYPEASWIFALATILIVGLLSIISSPKLVLSFIERTRGTKYAGRFTERLGHAYDSTRILLSPKRILFPTIVSVVSWFCECLGFFLVFSQFTPVTGAPSPDIFWAMFTYAFSAIVGALVMVLPGGLGVTEGSLGKLLDDKAGFRPADAAAITLVTRACTLWFSVVVGYFALFLFVRHHGTIDQEIEEEERAEAAEAAAEEGAPSP